MLSAELGFHHVTSSHSLRDVLLIYLNRFVRIFAFGSVAPILVLFLRELGYKDELVGSFISLSMLGDVVLSFALSWFADALGRRKLLGLSALLMCFSGTVFAMSDNYTLLLTAGVIGVISPSGHEVGVFGAIEQASLSQLVEPVARVHLLVWYQVFGFLGGAAGNFASGMFISGLESKGYTSLETYRFLFLFIYVAGATFNIVLSMCMTTYTEVDHPPLPGTTLAAIAGDNDSEATPLLPANPAPPAKLPYVRLAALCLLFSFDSFASSLIPTSFISYYFRQRFNAPITTITRMFGTSAIIAGVSQLAAGSIAKRLSLVLTMVCTHMPAQLLTISLAFAPTLQVAVSIFLVRAMIASMDSAVRGAFLAAIVPKASRTRFLGIVTVSKSLAHAPGASLSGIFSSWGGLRWSFIMCGCIKLFYDVGLLIGFKTAKLEH